MAVANPFLTNSTPTHNSSLDHTKIGLYEPKFYALHRLEVPLVLHKVVDDPVIGFPWPKAAA